MVSDGDVRRGHSGLAGEIAHIVTTGPDGAAMTFLEVFGALRLRHKGSTAIDVDALTTALSGTGLRAEEVRGALAAATSGIVSAAVALSDPELVVVGGTWGSHATVIDAIRDGCRGLARGVSVRPATVAVEAPLTGARDRAVDDLRSRIVRYRKTFALGHRSG